MIIEAGWVRPPPQVGGLDHLAVQAPCINIYGRLLPGITNVTDRARYYSFYPWLIWALDQAGFTRYDENLVERFRRADCLFSLIAERHAVTAGGVREAHAAAMVGANTLAPLASSLDLNGKIILSDYSRREGAKTRYFMNKLGGLGQYYLGVLRELRALDGDASKGIKYAREVGGELARGMDGGVDRSLFLSIVEADAVTASELEKLSSFCPCCLKDNSPELSVLADLFFVRGIFHDTEAMPRRRTLQAMLHLASQLEAGEELSEFTFKACTYAGSLPSGKIWETPTQLSETMEMWSAYSRNEIMSLAVQGLFYALLDAYEESGLRFESSSQLVDWYIHQPETAAALDSFGAQRLFFESVATSSEWLPDLGNWRHTSHEIALTEAIAVRSRGAKASEARRQIIVDALRTMIALASRADALVQPYGKLVFDKAYFAYYPANLQSFAFHAKGDWSGMTMRELLEWLLLRWGVGLHLHVALRKLRGQSQSTFRIRPSDRGMEVIAVPPAVHTRPRFNQAVRVLKDIGALEPSTDGAWRPSTLGKNMMELGDAP